MVKKEFDRNKPRRNIGEIGISDNITHFEHAMAMELFQHFKEQTNKKREQLLSNLISKYGQEVGFEKYLEIIEKNEDIYDTNSKGKK